jgi:6-phosphogluconolactonase
MFKIQTLNSSFGTVHIGPTEELFRHTIQLMNAMVKKSFHKECIWGFQGGSTPKAFFQWCVQNKVFERSLIERSLWSTSDERHVPLASDESNFGNMDRLLLAPLSIPASQKLSWPTQLEPQECAQTFSGLWNKRFPNRGFDICFLGMGDDCHTASLFPNCPLIQEKNLSTFAATEWPNKGWRLTITEKGFEEAQSIVITVTGNSKTPALQNVFHGTYNPKMYPIQLMKNYAKKVTWLIDTEAAGNVKFNLY